MATQTRYATNVDYPAGTQFGIENGSIYKSWDDLNNLKTANGVAQCRNPDNTETPTIAGRNGTYKRPAPIEFSGFNFDTSNMYNVEKVVVHYTHGKFINNGYYPEFSGPVFTLVGTNTTAITGNPVPAVDNNNNGTHYTVTFTGINVDQLNNMSLRMAYPSNTATTPGRIKLTNVYLEVFYNEGTSVVLSATPDKNPITIDDDVALTVSAKKTGELAYNASIDITLPTGLSYVTALTQTELTVGENVNHQQVIHWQPEFINVNNHTITMKIKLHASTVGSKKINIKETRLGSTFDTVVNVKKTNYVVWSNINKKSLAITEDKPCTIHVDVKSDATVIKNDTAVIDFTGNNVLNYDLVSSNADVTSVSYGSKKVTIHYKQRPNQVIRFTFTGCIWNISDDYTLSVKINNEDPVLFHYVVNPKEFGALTFSYYKLPDYYTLDIADGISYTVATLGTLIIDGNDYLIQDGGNNFRIGVYNDSLDVFNVDANNKCNYVLNDADTFIDHVVWCTNPATVDGLEQATSFVYNDEYPIIFVYSHTYVNDPIRQMCIYNFTDPYLVESSIYNTIRADGFRGIVPHPAHALLDDDKYAICTIPTMREAVPVVLSDWLDGGLLSSNIAIHGLRLEFDYVCDNDCMIEIGISLDEKTGTRNFLLKKGRGTASVGNAYDLFDLKIADLIRNAKDLELSIIEVNNFTKTVKPQINNARLTLYYVNIAKCEYGFSIDGERSEWYGIYLHPDIDLHRATENDKSEYHVEGTDETIINRLNIDPKELTIQIKVPNCLIKSSIPQIDHIVDLFTNEREIYSNKPIPKNIIFDIMPDRQYEFVRIKEFDDEYEGATYKAKIKLYVPSGTANDVKSTITGGEGYYGSNTIVKPIVTCRCDTKGSITITESYLNQYMHISSEDLDVGDIIVFDCINRRIYKGANVDVDDTTELTSSLDFNSSWFKLKGRYSFVSTDGTILSVEYYPRRA